MSINDTISQVAATNPAVGVAVAVSSTKSALLAGMQTGDTALAGLLGALHTQAAEAGRLLPSVSSLGQNVDLRA